MKKTDHHLFKEKTSEPNLAQQIEALRHEARQCRDAHNNLVKRLWEIDKDLTKPMKAASKHRLELEREQLRVDIHTSAQADKYQSLIKTIYDLEIQCYGHSDVGGHSPFIL